MYKLLIFGSRAIKISPEDMESVIEKSVIEKDYISEVISGGASGIDTVAVNWAMRNQIPLRVYPANWQKYGNSAGAIRNAEMVKECNIGLGIWDGKSAGTKITIDLLKKSNKKLVLFITEDNGKTYKKTEGDNE